MCRRSVLAHEVHASNHSCQEVQLIQGCAQAWQFLQVEKTMEPLCQIVIQDLPVETAGISHAIGALLQRDYQNALSVVCVLFYTICGQHTVHAKRTNTVVAR